MSTEPTDSLIQRFFDTASNRGGTSAVDELLAPDSSSSRPARGAPSTRPKLRQVIVSLRAAFPDLDCTVEDDIREGDRFAARWTMRGTNLGSYMGNAPTGKAVCVSGIIYGRYSQGKIAEDWTLLDQLSLLQQLGMIPPPRSIQVQAEN